MIILTLIAIFVLAPVIGAFFTGLITLIALPFGGLASKRMKKVQKQNFLEKQATLREEAYAKRYVFDIELIDKKRRKIYAKIEAYSFDEVEEFCQRKFKSTDIRHCQRKEIERGITK